VRLRDMPNQLGELRDDFNGVMNRRRRDVGSDGLGARRACAA
jgi:hypothetical protein